MQTTQIDVWSPCHYPSKNYKSIWTNEEHCVYDIIMTAKGFGNKESNQHLVEILNSISESLTNTLGALEFSLVVIPPSEMTPHTEDHFSLVAIAKLLGNIMSPCRNVWTGLRWIEPKNPSHGKDGSARNQLEYEKMMTISEIPPDHPIIIFDDVVTTGSQMKASTRKLRAAGANVVCGLTLADVPYGKRGNPFEWHKRTLETDPSINPYSIDLSSIIKQ